eukprot:TRINITY_DN61011_c0_g3_i1.p1 TRINITY_DN61011_c0_g3~~TRINITY_DN61011_c0_g3_i1.p1  ORF type:complete len:521 (-),score=57.51 TRINITY_DN61011_c0_g3_i1:613-2175(-)
MDKPPAKEVTFAEQPLSAPLLESTHEDSNTHDNEPEDSAGTPTTSPTSNGSGTSFGKSVVDGASGAVLGLGQAVGGGIATVGKGLSSGISAGLTQTQYVPYKKLVKQRINGRGLNFFRLRYNIDLRKAANQKCNHGLASETSWLDIGKRLVKGGQDTYPDELLIVKTIAFVILIISVVPLVYPLIGDLINGKDEVVFKSCFLKDTDDTKCTECALGAQPAIIYVPTFNPGKNYTAPVPPAPPPSVKDWNDCFTAVVQDKMDNDKETERIRWKKGPNGECWIALSLTVPYFDWRIHKGEANWIGMIEMTVLIFFYINIFYFLNKASANDIYVKFALSRRQVLHIQFTLWEKFGLYIITCVYLLFFLGKAFIWKERIVTGQVCGCCDVTWKKVYDATWDSALKSVWIIAPIAHAATQLYQKLYVWLDPDRYLLQTPFYREIHTYTLINREEVIQEFDMMIDECVQEITGWDLKRYSERTESSASLGDVSDSSSDDEPTRRALKRRSYTAPPASVPDGGEETL